MPGKTKLEYTVMIVIPKVSDDQNVSCNLFKFRTKMSSHREICTKGADGRANSPDPDLTASLGVV